MHAIYYIDMDACDACAKEKVVQLRVSVGGYREYVNHMLPRAAVNRQLLALQLPRLSMGANGGKSGGRDNIFKPNQCTPQQSCHLIVMRYAALSLLFLTNFVEMRFDQSH